MRVIVGEVAEGKGVASNNLDKVKEKIAKEVGLGELVSGTLNVVLQNEYAVPYSALVNPPDYAEMLKLKRCRIRGLRCVIVRPINHERENHPRLFCVEVMSTHRLRDRLHLATGDCVAIEVEGDNNWWSAQEPE